MERGTPGSTTPTADETDPMTIWEEIEGDTLEKPPAPEPSTPSSCCPDTPSAKSKLG
jgi:hypothetical protein